MIRTQFRKTLSISICLMLTAIIKMRMAELVVHDTRLKKIGFSGGQWAGLPVLTVVHNNLRTLEVTAHHSVIMTISRIRSSRRRIRHRIKLIMEQLLGSDCSREQVALTFKAWNSSDKVLWRFLKISKIICHQYKTPKISKMILKDSSSHKHNYKDKTEELGIFTYLGLIFRPLMTTLCPGLRHKSRISFISVGSDFLQGSQGRPVLIYCTVKAWSDLTISQ